MAWTKLNLGCGPDVHEDSENYDYNPQSPSVKHLDLNGLPWPFDDNYADEIKMIGSLEHLNQEPILIIRELHRVLKPRGFLVLQVPHIAGLYACMPDHRWYFSTYWFLNLCREDYCRPHDGQLFESVSLKMQVFHGRPCVLDWIASRWPLAWEKFSPIRPDTLTWTGRKVG